MSYRTFRRRFSEAVAEHEPLEIVTAVLGALFFLVAVFCVYATVVIVAHFHDEERGFPAGPGFIQGIKGFGLVLFPVFGAVALGAGWALAGDQVRRRWRRLRHRGDTPTG